MCHFYVLACIVDFYSCQILLGAYCLATRTRSHWHLRMLDINLKSKPVELSMSFYLLSRMLMILKNYLVVFIYNN